MAGATPLPLDVILCVRVKENIPNQTYKLRQNLLWKGYCKMIGLDIKLKNGYNNYLYKIFCGIDLSSCLWEIITDEIYYDEDGEIKEQFFGADIISGEEFIKCISRDSYYIIFADIKAYPLSNEHSLGNEHVEIKTLDDFLNSNCQMILLCTDCTFIEFYCKDRDILDKVYNNCIGDDFVKTEYKSVAEVSERVLIA